MLGYQIKIKCIENHMTFFFIDSDEEEDDEVIKTNIADPIIEAKVRNFM